MANKQKVKETRGAPKKAKASDLQTMIDKLEHEKGKFNAQALNELGKIYGAYLDLALGRDKFKDASIQTRKGALEWMINRLEESYGKEALAAAEKGDMPIAEETKVEEEEGSPQSNSLISFDFTKKKANGE